jgi:hypothetical protein
LGETAVKKIIEIKEEKTVPLEFDTKHLESFKALEQYKEEPKPRSKKFTTVEIQNITRKSSILFFLLPEWDPSFPPYNLARLSAVTKAAGYKTHVVDLNVEAYNAGKLWPTDIDFWHGQSEWRWTGNNYWNFIHPYLLPLLEKYLNYIGEHNVTVLGFTIYYCNIELANWFITEAKKRYPNIAIMAGGPQAHHSYWTPNKDIDYVVSGEGEENILKVLDQIEEGKSRDKQVWVRQQDGIRLDLDQLPAPDYSWVDFSKYRIPNGVCLEFSRGCTAKCVFCSETHFWKYRDRRSKVVVDEIEKLYNEYSVNLIWFLDSLVNGNIKELRSFCKTVIKKGLKIKWTGYARCDKRMDLEFYQDLADAGCFALNYGIESGCNKILKDMAKNMTVEIMEQNLADGKKTCVGAFTNWILGFPTETTQDFYETITFIIRNYSGIKQIAPGIGGFMASPDTIVGQDFDRFNLHKAKWENEWITKDLKNTKLHRLIRQKMFLIIMHEVELGAGHPNHFYTIDYKENIKNIVEFEQYNFDILDLKLNPAADSFINEIWAILRLLWRWRGAYSIVIDFDKQKDWDSFGDRLGCNITGSVKFQIDSSGHYKINYDYTFIQSNSTWIYHSYDEADSLAAERARRLTYKGSDGKSTHTYEQLCADCKVVEKLAEIDLSFKFNENYEGTWNG